MSWDGSRWVEETPRPTPSLAPSKRRRRDRAAILMVLMLVSLILPFSSAMAATSGSTSTIASWSNGYSVSSYEETSARIAYAGRWIRVRYGAYSGGRARASRSRGARATLSFNGTAVAWLGPVGPTRGSAKVYLDGKYVRTVSTYASRFQAKRVLFKMTFSKPAAHRLTIVVQGTPGRAMIAIDRFVVRGAPKLAADPGVTGGATPAPTQSAPLAPGALAYGPGIAADSLGNTQVGGTSCGCSNLMSSYRFRAGQSSALSSIHIYVVAGKAGYAGGTGGTIDVSVQADDGTSSHGPSGTVLAATSVSGGSLPSFPTITFPSPATLVDGRLYHIVFRNTDPSPTVNFISIDGLTVSTAATSPRQPRFSDTDWAQLMNSGSGWQVRPAFTPILQLAYSNGAIDGLGYMEAWVGSPKTISGSSKVRETFAVTGGGRTVSAASVRVKRVSGSGALTFRLETAAGGLIEEVALAAGPTAMSWQTASFRAPHELANGQSYNLVLSSPSDTSYETFAIRQGSSYGFDRATYYGDGRMQYTTGGSWINTEAWGNSSVEGDLQFFFR